MAATVDSVREEIDDTTEPYLFSTEKISEALDEAADDLTLRGISLDRALAGKLQRLMAARDLQRLNARKFSGRDVEEIVEGNKRIRYTELKAQLDQLDKDIAKLLRRLGNSPADLIYDNY